jgi:1-phosphatidylinositol phosphodiesterase
MSKYLSFLSLFKTKSKEPRYFKMGEPLTIRNISGVPLQLELVEHFDPAPKDKFSFQNVTMSIASVTNSLGMTNNITRAPVPEINADAKPFASRDVSIQLAPFTTTTTDIHSFIKHPSERLRLTFQTEAGGKHQMYCPVPTAETATLVALAPNPKYRFTGIYLSQHAYVTLYKSSNPNAWMSELADSTPLGALSIPGTHNSPTYHQAPPSVRCQAVPPRVQLENGVRFFDLRVQVPTPYDPNSDKLILVHSVFPIALSGPKYFRDLYKDIREFLDANPSETLIISFKREGTGNGTDEQLGHILKDHYANPKEWFTQPRVPILGEARGKIVLLRRFNIDNQLNSQWDGKGWGIAAAVWADNTPCATCPSGDVCVQDYYQVMEPASIDKKIEYAEAQMERSGGCSFEPGAVQAAQQQGKRIPLYVNFLSGSNFWNVGTWPEKIASKVNPACVEHLCMKHMVTEDGKGIKEGDWSTGIVVADWVGLDGDWDLVRCVVGMNAKLAG